MKNIFEMPLIELILLREADIISTSDGVTVGGNHGGSSGDIVIPGDDLNDRD